MSNIKTKIKELFCNLKQVFLRFPLACTFALALSIFFYFWLDKVSNYSKTLTHKELFYSLLWGCGIAVLLTFAADLLCHIRQHKLSQRIWYNVTAVLSAVACSLLIYTHFNTGQVSYYIISLLFAAFLIVLIWPIFGQRNIEMTWNYHFRLLYAIAVAGVFSSIIFLGIMGVLASIYFLFEEFAMSSVNIFVAIIFTFFCPCCIMALMPIQKEDYNRPLAYNKFTKVLVLYILLPLVCLEALVLYIYAFKILASWQLPDGGVAYLVFSYAIASSIVWYMLMPVFRSEQPSKLKFFDRGFFASLIPLLILLFVGLFRRIHDYGFTTNRYLVLIISCWFLAVALIMLFRKSRNVTPLSCSLLVISILFLVGPWSIFSVPESLQMKHFEEIATEYNLLKNGKIVASPEPLSKVQNIALSESIDFFMETEKYQQDFAERYFDITPAETDSIVKNHYIRGFRNTLMDQMNAAYIPDYMRNTDDEETQREYNNYLFINKEKKLYDISQYDYRIYYDNDLEPDVEPKIFQSDKIKIIIRDDPKGDIIHFQINNNNIDINVLDSLQIKRQCKYHEAGYNDLSPCEIFHEDAHLKLYISVGKISIEEENTDSSIDNIRFNAFVKLKE